MTHDNRRTVYVARQPILTTTGRVYGYELLYRDSADAAGCTAPDDLAGARVLTDAVLNVGLETLTDSRPAFFNVTRRLLLAGAPMLLQPGAVVFEIGENVPVDQDVIAACRELHRMGYALALAGFVEGSPAEALLPCATFVKVDVPSTTPEGRLALATWLIGRRMRLVAGRVETWQEAEEVRAAGYRLAQGHFFCRPVTFESGGLAPQRLAYLNLMAALNDPDITIDRLESLVKCDVAVSLRVLRCINSAAFGLAREVTSIREALVLLGTRHVRQWASVWALAGVHNGATPELVTMALLRARCCERLGGELAGTVAGSEFFLLGLCSLLEALVARPMPEALASLPLSARIREALLGRPNAARAVLDAVIAYERGRWSEAQASVSDAGLSMELLSVAYAETLRWSSELSRAA